MADQGCRFFGLSSIIRHFFRLPCVMGDDSGQTLKYLLFNGLAELSMTTAGRVRSWHRICRTHHQEKNVTEAAMVISMLDYRKARAARALAAARRYDQEEALCVNWNPAIGVIAMSCFKKLHELSPQLPEDFSTVVEPDFLERVYALATQI
jgi:hypothetical protein